MQYCKTVTLRSRPMKNGMLSLYLDYYPGFRDKITMKITRHESLGIYVYPKPENKAQKDYNEVMIEKAEAIRCRVFAQVVNENYEFFDKSALKSDFLQYYREVMAKKNQKWQFVYAHFAHFVDGHCTCEEVTYDLCQKFKEYLLTARNLKNTKYMSRNSVAGYWSTFRAFLNIAYRDKMIKDNVNDYLDRIKYVATEKQSLTLEELRTLFNTPCDIPVLKKASIFSCLTGLRRSDIINLEWNNFRTYADGDMYIEFVSQKTKQKNIIPVKEETYTFIGPRDSGKVFKGFTRLMTQKPLRDWLDDAGISKNITFHSFRHTFASLQLEMGTDIYTVQQLLAHKNVSTTQIYAQHADPKRREAANKITLSLLKEK